MSNRRLDPEIIARQVSQLLLQYPELDEDEALRADMIEGTTDAFEFLSMVERKRQDAEKFAEKDTEWIAEIAMRRDRFKRRQVAFRELQFKVMQQADLRKIELPEGTLFTSVGPPKVLIIDEQLIPDAYFRVKREPDKAKIGAMLKSGCEVAGATLSNAEPHLTIRTK